MDNWVDSNYKICIMLPKHDFYLQWKNIFYWKLQVDLKQELIEINKKGF